MDTCFNHLSHTNPLVRAIHTAVKGRARYKVSGLYSSEALKRYLELRLSQEQGIGQVRANHLTGNVLVFFHPDFSPQAIASLLQGIILDYTKKTRTLTVNTASAKVKNLSINNRKFHRQKAYAQENFVSDGQDVAVAVATKKDSFNGKVPNIIGSAILRQMTMQKQLQQRGNQGAIACGAVCILVVGATLLHSYGLDTSILLAIQKLHTPLVDRIMLGITFLGDPVTLLMIGLGLTTGLLYYNRRSEATSLGIAAVGAIALNCLLKVLFGRARPALWKHIIDVGLHSFPSGHAMVSIATYGFLGYLLAKQFPQSQKQIFALTIALIGAIGFSRLYLGVHWPTDVLAGYAAGLVWLIGCIVRLENLRANRELLAPSARISY